MSSTPSDENKSSGPHVAIIGAGAGGIAFAIELKRKLGFSNFTIYEKGQEVGGTWRQNVYPGCSSDVSMAFYSLSTDLYDWKGSHGSQAEILSYWKSLAQKYGIYPHIKFNSKVLSAIWDEQAKLYHLTIEEDSGSRTEVKAPIVVSAIGVLDVPRLPNIKGVETFRGESFHSATWDEGVKLAGKRVGVIGNGTSATQFVPKITEDPTVNVVEFCRTPNWFMPPPRVQFSSLRRWLFRKFSILHYILRFLIYLKFELFYITIFWSPRLRKIMSEYISKPYILSASPRKYHEKLIPKYPMGCKRVIFDTNYLSSLSRPNLRLNWDGIEEIVEDGIVTKTGEKIPLDVMIYSTGFVVDEFPLPVQGLKGQTIQEYFEAEKGPQAYLGTTFPGFPNFFTVFGPNTATGHLSVIYTNEIQTNYIISLITPILSGDISTLEVTKAATDAYNAKIHARLATSVFPNCASWYRVGGVGKITNIFPGAGIEFFLWLRKPKWEDYTGAGVERWRAKVNQKKRGVGLLMLLGLLVVGDAWLKRMSGFNGGIVSWVKETINWRK